MYDLCSDLHIEHSGIPNWSELQKNDILIVAGDTSNSPARTVQIMHEAQVMHHYRYVIVTDGNHEHYGNVPIDHTVDYFKTETANSNVIYLDGKRELIVDDVAYIGCNGWYDFNAYPWKYTTGTVIQAWQNESNDYECIDFAMYRGPVRLAEIHSDMLVEKVKKLNENQAIKTIIVTTHTVPDSRLLIMKNDSWDRLSGAYSNSLMSRVVDADVNHKIKFWNYGHTHTRQVKRIGHIIYVNNCGGYPGEYADFKLASIRLPA